MKRHPEAHAAKRRRRAEETLLRHRATNQPLGVLASERPGADPAPLPARGGQLAEGCALPPRTPQQRNTNKCSRSVNNRLIRCLFATILDGTGRQEKECGSHPAPQAEEFLLSPPVLVALAGFPSFLGEANGTRTGATTSFISCTEEHQVTRQCAKLASVF